MITKRLFFQIPKRQKKISTELTVLGKQQSEEVASAKPQDTAHPKRRFLMLSDSTVGFTLRETHKPAKAHRISEINQNFITSLMNTEVTSIRNSVSCLVGKGKFIFSGI